MKLGGLVGWVVVVLVVACSSGGDAGGDAGTARTWRCYVRPTTGSTYCECTFGTDQELRDNDHDPAAFTEKSCPEANYKCCELRPAAQSIDHLDSCICWNAETEPFCDGEVSIVSKCPG